MKLLLEFLRFYPGRCMSRIVFFFALLFIAMVFSTCSPTVPVSTPVKTIQPEVTATRQTPLPPTRPVFTPTQTPEPVSMLNITKEQLKGVVVRFWHHWTGPSGDLMQALVEEFNLTNPWGILAVEINQGNLDQIDEKLDLSKSNTDRPDLVVGYLHQALTWDEQIGLVDLNDYLKDPIWGYSSQDMADFYPVFWEYDFHQEKRLGIPAQRYGQLLFYNQSWARELGFNDVPLSTEIFAQQACAASTANNQDQSTSNDGTGGWIISSEYPAVLSWMYAFGGAIIDENSASLKAPYDFDQEQVLRAYIFLRDMYDQGCAWLPENPWPETYFSERKALFASGSISDIPYFLDALKRAGNTDQWTVLAYPGPEDTQVLNVYGPSFQVLASTEQQQLAAWMLMKWLLEPENQTRLVQTTFAYPLRISVAQQLQQTGMQSPAWGAAVDLLEYARVEPALRSWELVRWAISDSATQLFRSYTTLEQIPGLVRYLDQTAAELHRMVNED